MLFSCDRCDAVVRRDYMKRHKDTKTCKKIFGTRQQQQQQSDTTQQPNDNTIMALENENVSNIYLFNVDGVNVTPCPVEGCTFKSKGRYKMREHFRD